MANESPPIFKVIPTTQRYDWGKKGRNSTVAQFSESSTYGVEIDEVSPYAELWMGTHPKSPSHILSSNGSVTLSSHLASHPYLIGQPIIDKFRQEGASEGNLPFLFKVLSIEKALSIQTHPDKKIAEGLYIRQPDVYKDPNHKPEMAIALSPFQALCGFRPIPEIAISLIRTPELTALIPPSILSSFVSISGSATPEGQEEEEKIALKNLFAALMTAPESDVKEQLRVLLERYYSKNNGKGQRGEDSIAKKENEVIDLVKRLSAQFPGDIGIFCAFMLNFIKLDPGQAIFLGAGEPHAYIHGECIECMANSDNVIRAGLTPKLRDVPNLLSCLTYTAAPPWKHTVEPQPFRTPPTEFEASTSTPSPSPSQPSQLYDPPIPEFSVIQTTLSLPSQKETHRPIRGPSLVIVTQGRGFVSWVQRGDDEGDRTKGVNELDKMELKTGDVFFIGAETSVQFESITSSGEGGLVFYRAFVEV